MARDCLPVATLTLSGEPINEIGAICDFTNGVSQRLTLFCSHDHSQVLSMLTNQSSPFAKDSATLNG
ncbi:hypothetical protein D3C76_1503640 [compost metagenome]